MRILVCEASVVERAGSELATLEIASRLSADGHDVAVFALAAGRLAEDFRRAGSITLFSLEDGHALRAFAPDLIHAHDWRSVVSLEILGVTAPWVLGFLGTAPPPEGPPALIGNARVAWWTQSHRVAEQVQRIPGWMNAPAVVAGNWFDDQLIPRSQPTSITRISNVLLASNFLPGEVAARLKSASGSLGIAVTQVGLPDNPVEINAEMLQAFDGILTTGRTALESMALGRPVLLFGGFGSDGWVNSNDLDEMARHHFLGCRRGVNPSIKALIHWLASPPGVEDRGRTQEWAFLHASLSVVLGRLQPLYADACQSPPL